MKITKLDTDSSGFPENCEVAQGFIKSVPQSFLSLSIFFNDVEGSNTEATCSLSVSFITPVSGEDKTVESMFTLHSILSGYSVMDVVTKFASMYGKYGLFDRCDLGDQLFVSYIDETTSSEFTLSGLIEQAYLEPIYEERLMDTIFQKNGIMSPRLVK